VFSTSTLGTFYRHFRYLVQQEVPSGTWDTKYVLLTCCNLYLRHQVRVANVLLRVPETPSTSWGVERYFNQNRPNICPPSPPLFCFWFSFTGIDQTFVLPPPPLFFSGTAIFGFEARAWKINNSFSFLRFMCMSVCVCVCVRVCTGVCSVCVSMCVVCVCSVCVCKRESTCLRV
jgi:hypothetical protein